MKTTEEYIEVLLPAELFKSELLRNMAVKAVVEAVEVEKRLAVADFKLELANARRLSSASGNMQ